MKDLSKRVEINNEVAGCAQDFLDAVSAIGYRQKPTLVHYVMWTLSRSLPSQLGDKLEYPEIALKVSIFNSTCMFFLLLGVTFPYGNNPSQEEIRKYLI